MPDYTIPSEFIVGFQERTDTFTGKLGFVTHYTNKVKTKVKSQNPWTRWCDAAIPKLTLDNTPVDGFVLNKSVLHRGEKMRYDRLRFHDPRGFEFELQPQNLTMLLMYLSTTKGGGFQGKCVFGWIGAELWLLPIDSPEYKEVISFNSKVSKAQFNKANMVIGGIYVFKDRPDYQYTYLGYHHIYGANKSTYYSKGRYDRPGKNYHVYAWGDEYKSFAFKSGYTYLLEKLSDTPANPLDYTVLEREYLSRPKEIVLTKPSNLEDIIERLQNSYGYETTYFSIDSQMYLLQLDRARGYGWRHSKGDGVLVRSCYTITLDKKGQVSLKDDGTITLQALLRHAKNGIIIYRKINLLFENGRTEYLSFGYRDYY